MAKNRKTKKEKIRAMKRHASASPSHTSSESPTRNTTESQSVYTYAEVAPRISPSPVITTTSTHVTHLREDLIRTGVVTGAILLAEIILYFVLTGL